jgi:hypothetical protein
MDYLLTYKSRFLSAPPFDGEDKSWTPVTTSASGVWSKDGLTGVVTVTPERADFRFVPSFLRVNDSQEVNFIGVEPSESYVVSGRVNRQSRSWYSRCITGSRG